MPSDLIYERAKTLMEAPLGDELVTLDPDGGRCFGFNSVATSLWRLLEVPQSREALHGALLDEYEVEPEQCRRDVEELLSDLVGKGLIRERG